MQELDSFSMTTSNNDSIKSESPKYYKNLGARIASLRKSQGMVQSELARVIGVSQQAVFAYESGERRVSLLMLTRMGKLFDLSLDELAGTGRPVRVRKRRVSPRMLRHAERLQALPKTQQRFVTRIVDMLEAGNAQ